MNLPSVFVSEKPVSPKSGTLKSPPKGFDTTAINKSYYNVVSDRGAPQRITGFSVSPKLDV